MLFFAEMWERFCFYGMRALLVFYMVDEFAYRKDDASLAYGAYCSLVYATGVLGGRIADQVLGFRRAIIVGGIGMAIGEFLLLIPTQTGFFAGLAVIIVSNGLFKPNISTLVGKLYAPGDPRRDRGFTIFYMGINLGALLAPLVCGTLGSHYGWRWGFFAAGVGMLLGIGTFALGLHRLGEHGKAPSLPVSGLATLCGVVVGMAALARLMFWFLSNPGYVEALLYGFAAVGTGYLLWVASQCEREQRDRLIGLILLLVANCLFWAFFEQAGSSFNFFAENYVNLDLGFLEVDKTWFQSANPFFIVVLSLPFVMLWAVLERRRRNPSIPAKFALALVQAGLGFGVLALAIAWIPASGKTPFAYLTLTYFLHTTGELCISPIGLSTMTKLAPARIGGLVMGMWFLSTAIGNYLAGVIASWTGQVEEGRRAATIAEELAPYATVYEQGMWFMVGIGILMLLLSRQINRLLHGVR
jgi:POT family proton-dependent oligopeptide transporter